MTEEIDISKLHGVIKQYALACERDREGSKGYGKLNSIQEINLFKEMVIRNGKQSELKRQLPNIKGISVPTETSDKSKKQGINKHILNLMKENNTTKNQQDLKSAVSKKKN